MCGDKIFRWLLRRGSTSSHSEQRSQARLRRWYCDAMWESRWPPPFTSEGRVSSEEEIRSSFFCIGLSGGNGRDGVDGLWVKGNGLNYFFLFLLA